MDGFEVWAVEPASWDLPQNGPSASNMYRWEEDLVVPEGTQVVGRATFRGKINGTSIQCRGWISIDGDGGGDVLLGGKLELVRENGQMKVGKGSLDVLAVSSQSPGWSSVDVDRVNPKRYVAV